MQRLQQTAKIIAVEKLCPQFLKISFEAPAIIEAAQPGQFVHIRTSSGLEPFFRRPFSIYRCQKTVDVLFEVRGRGTDQLSRKSRGETLDILGPLGTPFVLPPDGVKDVVMVAGGVGVAPFLAMSDVLKKRKLNLILLYGGRTRGHVYPMTELKINGVKVHVATDDGSLGVQGRVSALFDKIPVNSATTRVYTCGPTAMMKAVQAFCAEKGFSGQASVEEVMACGLGACLGCSVMTRKGYRTACYDGPNFDLEEIVFR